MANQNVYVVMPEGGVDCQVYSAEALGAAMVAACAVVGRSLTACLRIRIQKDLSQHQHTKLVGVATTARIVIRNIRLGG